MATGDGGDSLKFCLVYPSLCSYVLTVPPIIDFLENGQDSKWLSITPAHGI